MITVTEKNRERGHIYRLKFDCHEDITLNIEVADENLIKVGSVISEEKIEDLISESDYIRAKQRAFWYLDRSSYTEKGLFDKLKKAGFNGKSCAEVIARLKELGLVDDERFASAYTEKLLSANTSKRQIYYKLCEKGISREKAKETVDNIDSDETVLIKNIIEKKYLSKLNDRQNTQKVYAALVRKGFSFGAVRDVLKQYEEELLYIDGD